MKLLQINTTVNSGSTGRIAEDIGMVLLANGHESFIAYGRGDRPSQSTLVKIGSKWDIYWHGLQTALFDRHGLASANATSEFIKQIKKISPDVIGLHNLHGYYLNIELLFNYLKSTNIKVVWTLFDCWSFTGHCTYFDDINCTRWIEGCFECPKTKRYPASYFLDNSKSNYKIKKNLYSDYKNLHLVVHSQWLKNIVEKSILKNLPVNYIASGVDLNTFKPVTKINDFYRKYNLGEKKIILGVASIWDRRKGLNDFIKLSGDLPSHMKIVLVGLTKEQIKTLPKNILGISRTENLEELATLYSSAAVFVNPTYQDNFPTTNIEALACGTPVISYATGGSPEAIDQETGIIVDKGNIADLTIAIIKMASLDKASFTLACRTRAERYYNKEDRYGDYLNLFLKILQQ